MRLLNRLQPRERVLVLGGGALLSVMGLWLYVWQPLQVQRDATQQDIARYLAVIEIARSADTGAALQAPQPQTTTPLGPRVTRSAEAAGISLARLDPDGPRLRITVAAADYADLTAWIAELESSEAVRALSVEMSRLAAPGQVSMQLLLEDAQ